MTTNHTPTFSFDGCGINGPDEYRSRIATFTNSELAKQYGPLFETACNAYDAHVARIAELEAALRECITESGAACYNIAKKTRRLEAINETARAALAKGQS